MVLGNSDGETSSFRIQDCHPLWCAFPDTSANQMFCNSPAHLQMSHAEPRNPYQATLAGLHLIGLGYFRVRSPLLTESLLLSLPQGTEMVHFPWFASYDYVFTVG